MLKFAYNGNKDVRVASTGDLTETYTPRTALIALDGSEDSKFAFYCEYNSYNISIIIILMHMPFAIIMISDCEK
jgi:hypothetical protein